MWTKGIKDLFNINWLTGNSLNVQFDFTTTGGMLKIDDIFQHCHLSEETPLKSSSPLREPNFTTLTGRPPIIHQIYSLQTVALFMLRSPATLLVPCMPWQADTASQLSLAAVSLTNCCHNRLLTANKQKVWKGQLVTDQCCSCECVWLWVCVLLHTHVCVHVLIVCTAMPVYQ